MVSRWIGIISCCLILFLSGCHSKTVAGLTAKVQRVVSGQTIEVIFTSSFPASVEKVRLIGIDAPNLKQDPWGTAARKRLQELVKNTELPLILELDSPKKDRFNRFYAYLWQDEKLLNETLLSEGYVLADSFPHKYSERFLYAQEYARLMGYGIWNSDRPMRISPEEFRSLNKE